MGSREVVFTSGGTEANNLALKAFGAMPLLVSAIEHPSVLNVRKDATIIPVGPDGCLNLDALEQLLTGNEVPMLVSVMAANNETGVIQPIEDVVSLARKHGAMVHSDAVQAAGKIGRCVAASRPCDAVRPQAGWNSGCGCFDRAQTYQSEGRDGWWWSGTGHAAWY